MINLFKVRITACNNFFSVESTNNGLKYNGTTDSFNLDNPLKYLFKIKDEHRSGVYEVEFTQAELDSEEIICKMVTTITGKMNRYLFPSNSNDIYQNIFVEKSQSK